MYLRRNFSVITYFFDILYQLLVAVPKNATLIAIKAKPKYIKAYAMGVLWHLANAFNKKVKESPRLEDL